MKEKLTKSLPKLQPLFLKATFPSVKKPPGQCSISNFMEEQDELPPLPSPEALPFPPPEASCCCLN